MKKLAGVSLHISSQFVGFIAMHVAQFCPSQDLLRQMTTLHMFVEHIYHQIRLFSIIVRIYCIVIRSVMTAGYSSLAMGNRHVCSQLVHQIRNIVYRIIKGVSNHLSFESLDGWIFVISDVLMMREHISESTFSIATWDPRKNLASAT